MDWDLVLKLAPIVISGGAVWVAISARNAAWENAKRAERAEKRTLEAEEAPRRVAIRVSTIHDDQDSRGHPRRHAKIFLKPPKNGDYCEVIDCKVEQPTGQHFEIRYGDRQSSGKNGNVVSITPRVILTDKEIQLNLSATMIPAIGDSPITLTFSGVRQDSARTPFTAVATIPSAGKAAPETIFD